MENALVLPALNVDGIDAVAQAIRRLDPNGEIVSLNVATRQVVYSARIRQHELIRDYVGEEEPVRAFLVAWLCTTGLYPPECIELERPFKYGRSGNAQLDVRISRPDAEDRAFALVETKPPEDWHGASDPRIQGQLFSLTAHNPDVEVLSLITLQVGDHGQPRLVAVTIDFSAKLTYQKWEKSGRPHVEDFPVNFQEPTQTPYAPGSNRDLQADITRPQLERVRVELHNKLWGGSRDDNQIYAWLVRLFLTKIHDEKVTDEGTPYRFQVMYSGSRKETPADTLKRVGECYQDAYRRYVDPQARTVERFDESLFSSDELQWVVDTIQGISMTSAGRATGDLLGGFFEAITRDGFKQSKGLFFTHYNLAVFMLEAVGIRELAERKLRSPAHTNDRLPYIIDPSCGSGTFLLAAMRLITAHVQTRRGQLSRNRDVREQLDSKFPIVSPYDWAREFIFGIEKREDLAISTKVNMVLHRDGHTHIYHDDGLAELDTLATRHSEQRFRPMQAGDAAYAKPQAESFDVIVTNPPFSITLDNSVRLRLGDNFELASDRNSENLFLERWFQLLKPRGRLAAVLPESFFSTSENVMARLFLMLRFDIRAIVSLPVHAFQPWTPTRTSLLFAQKRTHEEQAVWIECFDRHLKRVESDLKCVRDATRKIVHPGKRTSPQQVQAHVDATVAALSRLTLDVPTGSLPASEWASEVLSRVRVLIPQILAFRLVVSELGGEDYLGLVVSEIGYRRTRRAENAARNDLFKAVREVPGRGLEVVRNLNDSQEGWRIISSPNGEDALSKIAGGVSWL